MGQRILLIIVVSICIPYGVIAKVNTDSCMYLADEYYYQKDYLKAREILEEHLRHDPYNRKAIKKLTYCYYILGDMNGLGSLLERTDEIFYIHQRKARRYYNKEWRIDEQTKFSYPGIEVYPELGYRPRYTRADSLRGALRPERTCYDVYYYDLDVKINPISKTIEGKNTVYLKANYAQKFIQIDLFENMQITDITMDGVSLKYHREFNAVFVEMPIEMSAGQKYSIDISYFGKPNKAIDPPWNGGFVWSRDRKLNYWVGVACEQYGASSWWPVKDHLSDRPDSMAIHISVPKAYQAVSNGSFRGVDTLSNKYRRYNWFVSYPINSYNVTFYMGKYSNFYDDILVQGDTLKAWYHVLKGNEEKARKHFKQVNEVIAFYDIAFGSFPFPNDMFRMVESPYEGMEHQTAIAFGHNYSNYINSTGYLNRNYDYVIVHEAAHEWWGNSLTVADMADIWLHEGFATYAEYMFIEEKLGYESAIREIAHQALKIQNIWPMVQNRNVNENTFAGQDVYVKGAMLLHCLRSTINNDTLFKDMLRDFHLSYRDSIIQSSKFIDFVHEYTKSDYSALFNLFLFKTHPPVLKYSYKRVDTDIVLTYAWAEVDKDFTMPFAIEIIGSDKTYRLEATTQWQDIVLEDAESFRFFNENTDLINCPHNGYTYYNTMLVTEK